MEQPMYTTTLKLSLREVRAIESALGDKQTELQRRRATLSFEFTDVKEAYARFYQLRTSMEACEKANAIAIEDI